MLAPSSSYFLSRAIRSSAGSSVIGDLSAFVCIGSAVFCCALGDYLPKPIRTASLALASASCLVQYFVNVNEDVVNQAIANDGLRATELNGLNDQLMDQQAMRRSRELIASDIALLRQIASADPILQPKLLEEHGFGYIVPMLQEKRSPAPIAASRATITTEPQPPDLGDGDYDWIDQVLGFPAVLVFGPQGSGKSTLAQYLVQRRHQLGHEIEILDPHRRAGAWEGLACYGDGMAYPAVDSRLRAFELEIERRYKLYSKQVDYSPKPKTIVAEEMTNWSDRCRHAQGFLKASLSDNRKISMHTLFISHGRELALLGGSSGTSKMRDNGLLEIQLFSEPGSDGRPRPTGKGKLRWPAAEDWIDIDIPDLSGFQPSFVDPAEQFAADSGIAGGLDEGDRLDDSADLINLRNYYQEANPKPSGRELLERWNSLSVVKLETNAQTITGLLRICKLSDQDFQDFLAESLA